MMSMASRTTRNMAGMGCSFHLFLLLINFIFVAAQECNTVLDSWNKTKTALSIAAALTREAGDDGGSIFIEVGGAIAYGVEIRKICAKCSDFSLPDAAYHGFCGPTVYGHDQTFSGLVMLPLENDGSSITAGTLKGSLYAHQTETRDAPTIKWKSEDSDLELFMSVLVASMGQAVLLPDFMGYGESSAAIHKGYAVKKAYQTSTIPLWLKMEEIVAEETDCATAVSNSFVGIGYSEGGYGVLAIADAMVSLGKDVIRIHAGGAPLRTSSAAILKMVENVDLDLYPSDSRHHIALFLAAYSSTYEDLENFQKGQDMLSEDSREDVVDAVFQSVPSAEVRAVLPPENPLSVVEPDLLAWARNAIATGDEIPCESTVSGFNDLFCQATFDNDLVEMVENSPFYVSFCHSREDRVVAFENLPSLSAIDQNPLLRLMEATGTHDEAGTFCIVESTLWYRGPEFQSYQVTQKHSATGCPEPTIAPSAPPSIVSDGLSSVPSSSLPSELPSEVPSELPSAIPSELPSESPSSLVGVTGVEAQNQDSSAVDLGLDLLLGFLLIPFVVLVA